MENGDTSNLKLLGIFGFAITVFAFIFSLIPCLGMYATIPAIIGTVMALIAFINIKRNAAENHGLSIAGLSVGIVAILIGLMQYLAFQPTIDKIGDKIKEARESDVFDEIERQMETNRDSIYRANDSLDVEIDIEIEKEENNDSLY